MSLVSSTVIQYFSSFASNSILAKGLRRRNCQGHDFSLPYIAQIEEWALSRPFLVLEKAEPEWILPRLASPPDRFYQRCTMSCLLNSSRLHVCKSTCQTRLKTKLSSTRNEKPPDQLHPFLP